VLASLFGAATVGPVRLTRPDHLIHALPSRRALARSSRRPVLASQRPAARPSVSEDAEGRWSALELRMGRAPFNVLPAETWPNVAAMLAGMGGQWPDWAIFADLAWHWERSTRDHGAVPMISSREFATRWKCGHKTARIRMRSEESWKLVRVSKGHSEGTARAQRGQRARRR